VVAPLKSRSAYPLASNGLIRGKWVMEYKHFVIKAFERKPSKWRAIVQRSDGKPMMVTGRAKLDKFVTGVDATTAQSALLMAMAAIDAEAFSRRGSFARPQTAVSTTDAPSLV
jgi:hypothetical protein